MFTELLGFVTETGNLYDERNAQRSVPQLGALLAYSLVGLAGPRLRMKWRLCHFRHIKNAASTKFFKKFEKMKI
jgi:hypothetical protein